MCIEVFHSSIYGISRISFDEEARLKMYMVSVSHTHRFTISSNMHGTFPYCVDSSDCPISMFTPVVRLTAS